MFIQTENTPNPATLKFIPENVEIAGKNPTEFKTIEQAKNKSILAEQLFSIEGVEAVFLGSDFVTITKSEKKEWQNIKTEILATIMDFCLSGKPAIIEQKTSQTDEEDSEVVKQIKELIEVKVRPAVAMDGGDIIYRGFENGVVKLQLKGSCSGCPSSTVTLKNGIENMLKHYIPEVEAVEEVDDEY
ncbi:MAG: NifU family protein [Rickettsiaceae bacterium]|jgi:Fe-S cluster biogenesis protein NfuA|nr:NifU family protein [Rickettsiaceae bacterium]